MGVRFGQYARSARLDQEVTLKAVADAIGFTPAYISDIERGNRNPPTPAKVRQWAILIGADPEKFVRLAALDRSAIELPLTGSSATKGELALTLARAWDHLTPEQEEQLMTAIEHITRSQG